MNDDPLGAVVRTVADIPVGPLHRRLMNSINLMDNNIRGVVAEVLVAESVGAEDGAAAWASWDVTTPDDIKIEVKSSGYNQSWVQERRSAPSFDIAPKSRLESTDKNRWPNPLHGERRRWADVYVFCLHDGFHPDIPSEWTFFVIATRRLDEVCPDQKKITLGSLIRRLGATPCTFDELDAAIRAA